MLDFRQSFAVSLLTGALGVALNLDEKRVK